MLTIQWILSEWPSQVSVVRLKDVSIRLRVLYISDFDLIPLSLLYLPVFSWNLDSILLLLVWFACLYWFLLFLFFIAPINNFFRWGDSFKLRTISYSCKSGQLNSLLELVFCPPITKHWFFYIRYLSSFVYISLLKLETSICDFKNLIRSISLSARNFACL